ncbi:sensor histidine kinase [Actinocrispum wychmicini]|uniref:Signal transduction histidine kinase n=1 Tax=Actinocrispum wychmicini TaxID=1213861 RepID=A0A4V2S848_9PSEU|nr:ATP-binding protein [Actinocrispum wychmicini]TCO62470.1 signal transduction histidine kinase [Actinocrispum wychmicini]
MTGPAERELDRVGLRYAVMIRCAVVAVSSLVTLVTTTARQPAMAAVVIVGFVGWNLVFTYGMIRRRRPWLMPVDLVVVAGVCLAQVWTAVPGMRVDRVSWVLAAASIIVVAYQFHAPVLLGAVATVVVLVAYLTGAVLAKVQDWTFAVPIGSWVAVEAALGRGLYLLVRRGGRRADREFARGAQVRREAAVATARRADEREYLAALHDTASATLLMVGAGVAAKPEAWLSHQAVRDLDVISGQTDPVDGEVDLVPMLRHAVEHVPLRVDWRLPANVTLPAVVAIALCRGLREALTNVVRHAGVDAAEVAVVDNGELVAVSVRDHGRGFDPTRINGHGYGLTASITERMTRMGGRADITSAPGEGTEIRLEWPHEPA